MPAQSGRPAGSAQSAQPTAPDTIKTPSRPSSIFGTNMALFDGTDQIVNSRATRQLLKEANVPMMRMPFRSAQGAPYETKALQTIRYIGAVPVVIVHGFMDPAAIADDRQLIALVQRVFGDSLVYVEFGNEP